MGRAARAAPFSIRPGCAKFCKMGSNSGAGQVVYTAAATDPAEDGPSNPVTYSFGGGVDDALFSIDAGTGAVTLTANPDDETKGSYSVDVTATDAAGNATTQTVTLEINDLGEDSQGPTGVDFNISTTFLFSSGNASLVPTNSTIGALAATGDPNSSSFTYQITDALGAAATNTFFAVASDGTVSTTASAAVNNSTNNFFVVATDQAGNSSGPIPITIYVGNNGVNSPLSPCIPTLPLA